MIIDRYGVQEELTQCKEKFILRFDGKKDFPGGNGNIEC